jgi:RNA polymerase sigma-70 factor, ECF subfamily
VTGISGPEGATARDEARWVRLAQRGDERAFAQLVEAYQLPVYNLAYRMLGSGPEAEDAAQETFLRVYSGIRSYDDSRKLSSWILSIASHYCIDRLRRRRGATVSMEELDAVRWMPDASPRPEDQLLADERDLVIQRVLGSLPEQYRLAVILRYWQDLSYDEIAEITDSTDSAVKSRLHRARQAIAAGLSDGNARRSQGAERSPVPAARVATPLNESALRRA